MIRLADLLVNPKRPAPQPVEFSRCQGGIQPASLLERSPTRDSVRFFGVAASETPHHNDTMTAGRWDLAFQPDGSNVTVTLTQARENRPKEKKRYIRVLPEKIKGKQLRFYKSLKLKQIFTRNPYLGVAQDFYNAGNRWGVSLGGTPEEFRRSPLCIKGKIGLPDGKYLVVVKPDASGQKPGEVIIGREARNAHADMLEAFRNGTLAPLDARHVLSVHELDGNTAYTVPGKSGPEFLKVPNHSALASRGKPYDPQHPEEYAVVFAGEWEIRNGRIIGFHRVNTQSGQFMGPAGTLRPPSTDPAVPAPPSITADPEQHQNIMMSSLLQVATHLENMLGLSPGTMDLVKVQFKQGSVRGMSPETRLSLSPEQSRNLKDALAQAPVRTLLENLPEGESQLRFVRALANIPPETRQQIVQRVGKYADNAILKPLQASALALQLAEDPSGLSLFTTSGSFANNRPNLARKLMDAFTITQVQGHWPAEQNFADFYETVLRPHQALMSVLTEQRVPTNFLKKLLSHPDRLPRMNQYAGLLVQLAQTSPDRMAGTPDFELFQNFLMTLASHAYREDLDDRSETDRKLQRALAPHGVDLEDLYAFTRQMYHSRWSGKQIILAYTLDNPGLGRFIKHVMTGILPTED